MKDFKDQDFEMDFLKSQPSLIYFYFKILNQLKNRKIKKKHAFQENKIKSDDTIIKYHFNATKEVGLEWRVSLGEK